ncbi:hypothetical protein PYCCODRAFT_1436077 [Trametes coccinea BRFM310]|uniref:Uncharacterized protein n=1 Tax=Trametes coccinea (strain BRFM310) TaxID=1353009 RepID=A0A1Y2IKY1_TRAC3|nr:hypothetical protein PYCCODRAFT_1436077 [Trametes coccinea BRFM310]
MQASILLCATHSLPVEFCLRWAWRWGPLSAFDPRGGRYQPVPGSACPDEHLPSGLLTTWPIEMMEGPDAHQQSG